MPEKFYVTTPIYYVNARPHIGHAYTTIVADVLARRHRAQGEEVWFLTGTDEHGQKIERSAAAAGIPPQQFTDEVSAAFQGLWARMGLTPDQYIRTTDEAHKRGVQHLFRTLYNNGQIYLSSYTGQYSIGEEMFVEGPPGTLGPDGRPTETVTEENFFFRLSDYQLPLLNLIESDELKITPESRKNEVLSFLRGNTSEHTKSSVILSEGQSPQSKDPEESGAIATASNVFGTNTLPLTAAGTPYVPGALKDLSISRSSFTWGIPVPEDIQQQAGAKETHIIYVWLDALANYITAFGYGSDDTSNPVRKVLARRPPPRRQGNHSFPLRLLARLPHGRRPPHPQSRNRPRLAPLRRLQDEQVQGQHRPHRNHPRRLRPTLPPTNSPAPKVRHSERRAKPAVEEPRRS